MLYQDDEWDLFHYYEHGEWQNAWQAFEKTIEVAKPKVGDYILQKQNQGNWSVSLILSDLKSAMFGTSGTMEGAQKLAEAVDTIRDHKDRDVWLFSPTDGSYKLLQPTGEDV